MRAASSFSAAFLLCAVSLLQAQTPTILHTFTGPDGAQPVGTFVQTYEGNLVGTTNAGGSAGLGTVYQISPSGTFTLIHSFTGGTDGGNPASGVTLAPDGSAYGTSQTGGANSQGTAWKISATGVFTTLHAFGGTATHLNTPKHPHPQTEVEDGEGPSTDFFWGPEDMLWGTTLTGGANNLGTVFFMTPDGEVTIVHDFSSDDGENPTGGLLWASDGNFYGTAQYGGEYGFGTLFRVTPEGDFTVLWNFTGGVEDGGYPCAGLEEDPDGTLWGETMVGGVYGFGTDFSFSISSGNLTTDFDYDGTDGNNPDFSQFLGGNGSFFGSTNLGGSSACGSSGCGTLFWYNPSSPGTVNSFNFNGTDGASPAGGVFQALDGDIYTTTQYGGSETDEGFILKFPMGTPLPPIQTVTLGASTLTLGGSTTLAWNVLVGYSNTRRNCFAMGTDTSEWSGWQPASGSITITPTVLGNNDYALICGGGIAAWAMLDVTPPISKYSTTTSLAAPASVVLGTSATLTATVLADGGTTATGNVNFQFNGMTFATAALNAGGVASTTLPSTGLPLGSYSITAVYGGDATHYGSQSSAVIVSLVKQPTVTTLTSSASGPVTQGGALTLTATVTGGTGTQRPTGTVTFQTTVNNATVDIATINLNNKQVAVYTANTSVLPVGTFAITAVYDGDQTFAVSTSAPVSVTIKAASTTSVTASANPLAANTTITLTATVQGDDPSGRVIFSSDGSQLAGEALNNGVATFITNSGKACAVHEIGASYAGDSNNAASTGTTSVQVLGTTTTTVTANPSTVKQGSSTMLTATVTTNCSAAATGTVTFSVAGSSLATATLSGGTATFKAQVTTLIDPGTYPVEASYSGDANNSPSSGTTSVTVTK